MRIYIVSQYYPPEVGAPQARLSEMAGYWAKEGNDVRVFTCFANHPNGILNEEDRGSWFRKDLVDNIPVYRHRIYVTPNKGFLKKIISHLSFLFSFLFLSAFRGPKPDYFVVSSPTFFVVIGVWLVSILRRVPFVFEVRDLWPGIFIELGVLKNRFLISILSGIELFLYRRAKCVVVVSKGFKEDLVNRGIPAEKVYVVTNGVNIDLFATPKEPAHRLRLELGYGHDDFIVLYIGAHGISQGLTSIIRVAEKLIGTSRIKFLFVGEGADKQNIIDFSQDLGLSNIRFLPGIKRELVPNYYHLADCCLVPLKNIEGFSTFIPSKMFEILASRTPIVASVKGESAKILNESRGAFVVEPENVNEIAEAIEKLSADEKIQQELGDNGFQFVTNFYNRRKLAENYLDILRLNKIK